MLVYACMFVECCLATKSLNLINKKVINGMTVGTRGNIGRILLHLGNVCTCMRVCMLVGCCLATKSSNFKVKWVEMIMGVAVG